MLGSVGTAEEAGVLARALDHPERLVREHAACALARPNVSLDVDP